MNAKAKYMMIFLDFLVGNSPEKGRAHSWKFFFSMKSFFILNVLKIVREFSPQISFQEKFKKEKTGTVAEPGMANKVR